jgi:predicted nucleic acid-binding protein
MREVLVVNASPLIFLGNAHRLDLLQSIGAQRILVPDPVFVEVTSGGHTDVAAAALLQATWCERTEVKQIPPDVLEWDLGPGESSVIAVALQTPGACAVIDDLNGRKSSLVLGVDVIGTLGIVLVAHRRGVIGDPRAVLAELRSAGMWLSDAVITRALRLAGIDS